MAMDRSDTSGFVSGGGFILEFQFLVIKFMYVDHVVECGEVFSSTTSFCGCRAQHLENGSNQESCTVSS